MKRKRVLSICSGGLDSTVLYFFLLSEGYDVSVLNFYYGSKHNTKEREALKTIIPSEKITFINIDLSMFKSSLLQKDVAVPEGHYAAENMRSTVVPFRNGIMLSYAIGFAESEGYDAVALGNHSGDHFIYPDCRPEFIAAISQAASHGTFNHVEILTPFITFGKHDIVKVGHSLGIDAEMAKTWSCYKGGEKHCGKCGTCVERKEAFALANVIDQTEYEDV